MYFSKALESDWIELNNINIFGGIYEFNGAGMIEMLWGMIEFVVTRVDLWIGIVIFFAGHNGLSSVQVIHHSTNTDAFTHS